MISKIWECFFRLPTGPRHCQTDYLRAWSMISKNILIFQVPKFKRSLIRKNPSPKNPLKNFCSLRHQGVYFTLLQLQIKWKNFKLSSEIRYVLLRQPWAQSKMITFRNYVVWLAKSTGPRHCQVDYLGAQSAIWKTKHFNF